MKNSTIGENTLMASRQETERGGDLQEQSMDDKNNQNSGKYSNSNFNQTSIVMMKK